MQVLHFFLDKICKLLTYRMPFYRYPLQSYQRSKMVHFFRPTLYNNLFSFAAYCSRLIFMFTFTYDAVWRGNQTQGHVHKRRLIWHCRMTDMRSTVFLLKQRQNAWSNNKSWSVSIISPVMLSLDTVSCLKTVLRQFLDVLVLVLRVAVLSWSRSWVTVSWSCSWNCCLGQMSKTESDNPVVWLEHYDYISEPASLAKPFLISFDSYSNLRYLFTVLAFLECNVVNAYSLLVLEWKNGWVACSYPVCLWKLCV